MRPDDRRQATAGAAQRPIAASRAIRRHESGNDGETGSMGHSLASGRGAKQGPGAKGQSIPIDPSPAMATSDRLVPRGRGSLPGTIDALDPPPATVVWYRAGVRRPLLARMRRTAIEPPHGRSGSAGRPRAAQIARGSHLPREPLDRWDASGAG